MAIKTFLTPTEITRMIESTTNTRDRVLLTLLSDCGCRVSELLAISPADFDQERQVIIIPHLKRGTKKHCPKCEHVSGRSTRFCAKCGHDLSKIQAVGVEERHRMVSIGSKTAEDLQNYIEQAKINPTAMIFPITRQMVYKVVRDASAVSGLAGKIFLNTESGKHHYVHPHDFRSALAVSWLDFAGGDANKQKALQEHLGHKSFDTTMRYNKLAPAQIKTVGDEVRKARFGDETKG